jgi:hypothetical protein
MQLVGNQLGQRVVRKLRREVNEAVERTNYRFRQMRYAHKLPELDELGKRIVREVNETGISIVHLDELNAPSNADLKAAIPRALEDLDRMPLDGSHLEGMEYDKGFEHCVPLNPTHIAKNYPEFYMWGLDERVLDIIDNLIGLPIAYHGVQARKEFVDGSVRGSRHWHRDSEDRNIIRINMYLRDVLDNDGGPFEYVPRNLTPHAKRFSGFEGRIDDDVMRKVIPESQWRQCIGPAGTVIFGAVAKIYHHGRVPKRPRCAAAWYYTTRQPTREALCREFSFERGIPFIDPAGLTHRQRECLWDYAELLPE